MSVRAKIKVASITKFPAPDHPEGMTQAKVTFAAVCRDDPSHENKVFWEHSPTMDFTLHLSARATGALEFFERMMAEKREMYLDFSPAD